MSVDMNMDVGTFFKNLFQKSNSKNKDINNNYIIYIAILIVISIFFLALYYIPKSNSIEQKKNQLNEMNTIQNDINMLDERIIQLKKEIKILEDKANKLGPLFHNENEVEALFKLISMESLRYGLTITKLNKGDEVVVFTKSKNENGITDPTLIEDPAVEQQNKKEAYTIVPLVLHISGDYLRFLELKKKLSLGPKIINFQEEIIKVLDKSKGLVSVKLNIYTYRLANIQTVEGEQK